jgi:hypothetical protein
MRILFFGLYSGIWPHALLETQIMKSLSSNSEVEMFYLTCEESLQGICKPREYHGLNNLATHEEMQLSCKSCKKNSTLISKTVSSNNISLKDYLNDYNSAEDSEYIKCAGLEELLSYKHRGISVGQYALYDSIINFKKNVKIFSNSEINFLRNTVQNSILAVEASRNILPQINPDVILCSDIEYGVARSFCEVAAQRSIEVYRIANTGAVSEKMKTRRIYSWKKFGLTDPALAYWPEFKRNLSEIESERVMGLLSSVKKSSSPWTYSAASLGKSARQEFNIPKEHKIVLAVLSSTDEYLAAVESGHFTNLNSSPKVFEDQTEWIKFLLSTIRNIPNVTLVIRLHPREYPNKREKLASEQSNKWDQMFRDLPDRVVLDHPSRMFPLSDYWNEISVLTTGWSSTALEAVSEGIPAVLYDKNLPLYPHNLVIVGESAERYLQNLKEALDSEVSREEISNVLRWLWLSNFGGAFKLRGGLLENSIVDRNKPVRIFFLLLQRFLPNFVKKLELMQKIDSNESRRLVTLLTTNKLSAHEPDK